MKIGVLTHPLLGNYGGILQAYAMVQVLRDMGHDAYNLEYEPRNYLKRTSKKSRRIKEALRILMLKWGLTWFDFPTPQTLKVSMANYFKNRHIPTLTIEKAGKYDADALSLDACVVGSDQVWRGAYAQQMKTLPFYFLDFVPETLRRNSISYAASFGSDTWEGNEQDTRLCADLLQGFKAVSVREDSGIELCHSHFGVSAERMPDPTMLLSAERYSELISQDETWLPNEKFISAYVLDKSPHISQSLNEAARASKLKLQQLKALTQAKDVRERFPLNIVQWLRMIRDCECLITDSFHGCVFAIMFNTPFVCLGNKKRGTSRFDSLLGRYGLQDRLVVDAAPDKILSVMNNCIDWSAVNEIRSQEQRRGLDFLKNTLPA